MSISRMESVVVVLLLPLLLFSFVLSQQDFFGDLQILHTVRDTLNRQPNDDGQLSQAEVMRIFSHHPPDPAPAGPLQRAINAQPALYAALLFTVFRGYFAEEAFPPEDRNAGRRNPLLVMLKEQYLLPERYNPPGRLSVTVRFEALNTDYIAHLDGRLVPADQAAALLAQVGVLPDTNDPDPNQVLAVPELFQPLLVTERVPDEPVGRMQAEQRYGDLEDRFLQVYVANYLVPVGRRNLFLGGLRPSTRLVVLKTLYWMLVVRPFQGVIVEHPELFPGIDPNELAPDRAFAQARVEARVPVPAPAPVRAPAPAPTRAPSPAPAPAPAPATVYVLDPAQAFAFVPASPPPPLPQSKCTRFLFFRTNTNLSPFHFHQLYHRHFRFFLYPLTFSSFNTHRRDCLRRRPSHSGHCESTSGAQHPRFHSGGGGRSPFSGGECFSAGNEPPVTSLRHRTLHPLWKAI